MDSKEAWDAFRANYGRIEHELTRALTELVARFNVSDRATRFTVGDVVEYVLAASFFAVDVLVLPRGANQNDFDLDSLVSDLRARFSVKSTFSDPRPPIGMKNKQGRGRVRPTPPWEWVDPVLFVIAGIGIVYADPRVHTDLASKVYDDGDAYRLNIEDIQAHTTAHPDCLIAAPIPFNPKTGHDKASRTVFLEIVDHPAYPVLSGFMQRTRAMTTGWPIFEALDEARERFLRGELTQVAYDQLVEALTTRVGRQD